MVSVVVVIGPGSIGQAIVRRIASGKHILLADISEKNLESAAQTLSQAGFEVSTASIDVSSAESVRGVVDEACLLGDVTGLIHAAGVSASQASIEQILRVDLYGTALVLEEFGKVIAAGGAGVVISSQSGHRLPALTPEQDRILATTPASELLTLPMLQIRSIIDLNRYAPIRVLPEPVASATRTLPAFSTIQRAWAMPVF